MKKLFAFLLAAAGLLATASTASADGALPNPANVPSHPSKPFARFFQKQPLPAFQAAPWYLYWPYNSHFMTPAPPLDDQFGGPGGGGYVNPYFPAPYGPGPRKW